MVVEKHIYDRRFFSNHRLAIGETPKILAQIIIDYFQPKNIIDVGCGDGWLMEELALLGVNVLGCDGSPDAINSSNIPEKIILHDLCQPFYQSKVFDLAICLEVAEHLPENCADALIDSLCRLSSNIIFTAAVPGQGPRSIGHINEQEPTYWINKFLKNNFILNQSLTLELKEIMTQKNIVWWLVNNIQVYEKK